MMLGKIVPQQQVSSELGDAITKHFLPLYHVFDLPTPRDINLAKENWKLIDSSSSNAFMEDRLDSSNPASLYGTCLEYYCDVFFDSMFEIDSSLRSVLHEEDGKFRCKWVLNLFKTILNNVDDNYDFNKYVQRMVRDFLKLGMTMESFILVGEMTFFSLSKVLQDEYTHEVHMAWIKIFSWMLRVVIPLALTELLSQGRNGKEKRIAIYGDWNRISNQTTNKNKKSACKSLNSFTRFFRSMLSWKSNGIYSINESETDCSDTSSCNECEC